MSYSIWEFIDCCFSKKTFDVFCTRWSTQVMCTLIIFRVTLIAAKEWVYSLINLRRPVLTSRLSPWRCGRNVGCWCLGAGRVRRDGDRERQTEKESVGNPLGEAWRNIVSGSYRLGILIEGAGDGQASACTHTYTNTHTRTHTHTSEWRVCCCGVSLSFVNSQLVSSEK